MNLQKKLLEDILSSYNVISENRKFIIGESLVKLNSTGYSNLKYDMDGTQNDEVNKSLLDDLNTAAKSAGVTATITTAKTGHNKNVAGSNNISRHMNGTGVDVAIIDGIDADGATGPNNGNKQFRELGNKLKNALVSMGYSLNVESGNQKAVLWQTNTGGNHFNHLHISNTGGVSQESPKTTTTNTTTDNTTTDNTTTDTTTTKTGGAGEFAKKIGSSILNSLTESFNIDSFGDNAKSSEGKILIPKKFNSKIKSPVSGECVDIISDMSCVNQIVIEFNDGYLEYCGITRPKVKVGDRIKSGEILGNTESNVVVTMFSNRKKKIPVSTDKTSKQKIGNEYSTLLVKGFKGDKNSSNKETNKINSETDLPKGEMAKNLVKGYRSLKNAFKKESVSSKKLDENIEKIKNLLK